MPSKIDKNSILTAYGKSCHIKGFYNQETSTTVKGELQSTPSYPPHHCLIINCKMKPSLDHQYEVSIVSLDNIIVLVVKNYEKYFWRLKIYITYQRSIECTVTWSTTSYVWGLMTFRNWKSQDLITLLSWAFFQSHHGLLYPLRASPRNVDPLLKRWIYRRK